MVGNDLHHLELTELTELTRRIHAKESPVEATQAELDRIAALDRR